MRGTSCGLSHGGASWLGHVTRERKVTHVIGKYPRQAGAGPQAARPHHLRGRDRRRARSRRSCRSSSACWAISRATRPQPLKPLKDRKFIQIDRDNFNDVMATHDARPEPPGREHAQGRRQRDGRAAQVQRRWRTSSRAKVVEQVEPLRKLLETRDKLRDLLTKVDRSDDLESLLEQVLQEHREAEEAGRPSWASSAPRSHRREVSHECRRTSQAAAAGRRDRRRQPRRACSTRSSTRTKQTERPRAEDLISTLTDEALKGTVTWDKNVTQTHQGTASQAIDAGAVEAARRHHAPPRLPEAGRDLARPALPGHEQRDQRHAQDQGAERLQDATCSRTWTRRSSSTRARSSRRSTRTSSARPAASRTAR